MQSSQQLVNQIARLVWEKKGVDILIMDLRRLTSMTDFFVIASVDTDVQARAIVDHLKDHLRSQDVRPWHVEGSMGSNWILLDYVNVVVHLFRPQTRQFYNLERLWGDAKIIEINDDSYEG
ncbi:ribosome silencing factor [candidate division KSB1 bacterium]|nr:ribosome silencing factor [candidate division KSB1 bacterium]